MAAVTMKTDATPDGRKTTLIVGLGRTGLACARHLARRGLPFRIVDSRSRPPGLAALEAELPGAECVCGPFDTRSLDGCGRLVLSPGVAIDEPLVEEAGRRGIPVVGDIDLLAEAIDAPVLAVTGSNGKSTVVALLGEMARRAGLDVAVGGNIGTPALDLLDRHGDAGLYVLELSSFQLETTHALRPHAAAILNISPDHLDRHHDLAAYRAAKMRLIGLGDRIVVPRDEGGLMAASAGCDRRDFGLGEPVGGMASYGLRVEDGREWLCRGRERICRSDEIALAGRHNLLNALAALALFDTLPSAGREAAIEALRTFAGLPHRMQAVADRDGILWIDDSKATNVGATEAALRGLDRPVILIAGGQAKGADLSGLAGVAEGRVREALLIGVDAGRLARALDGVVRCRRFGDLNEAVREARRVARPGDVVLLSPACASLDMFTGFEERGEAFAAAVRKEVGA